MSLPISQSLLEKISHASARCSQSSWAFFIVMVFVVMWLIAGPLLQFNPFWQNIMSHVSGIVTLVMVFVLQRAHNKDSLAMQIKLNEIIATLRGANNRLISIEDLSEKEIEILQKRYQDLAKTVQHGAEISTHVISAIEN